MAVQSLCVRTAEDVGPYGNLPRKTIIYVTQSTPQRGGGTAAAVGEEKNTTITKKCSPHPTSARSTSLKCFGHLLRWRRLIPLNDNLYKL